MISVYILTVVIASAAPGVTVAPTVDVNVTTSRLDVTTSRLDVVTSRLDVTTSRLDVVTTKSPVDTTTGDVDATESETTAVIETTTPGGWSDALTHDYVQPWATGKWCVWRDVILLFS